MAQKSVLIAGATGTIGRAVVTAALARGYRVTAIVRPHHRAPFDVHENLHITRATFSPTAGWSTTFARADVVISCLASRTGTAQDAHMVDYAMNAALLDQITPTPDTQFILLSAICVQKPKLAFQFEKLRFEALLQGSGLPYSIVRPTAYFKSLSGQIDRIKKGKAFLYFGDGTSTSCMPISERDLANFMIDCIDDQSRLNRILPIGGPHPALTPRDQAEMLFDIFGQPPKVASVSPRLFDLLRLCLAPFAPLSQWVRNKRELLAIGKYYATESMLCWDADQHCYDASATPSTGTDSLRDHYLHIQTGQIENIRDKASRIY